MRKFVVKFFRAWRGFLLLSVISQTNVAGTLSPYSVRELEELEKEFIQQINQSNSVERNPLASQFINGIGKRLSRAGHLRAPYFFIVKSNEINAFAGPGGYIGVNTRLILTTQNESELAAVMAHELAHVRLHHLYSMIEHQKQMRIPMLASMLASIALGVLNPSAGMGAMMASLSGFSQNSINFTRSKEKEADRIGIDMLIKAGFNPLGMAAFFKKMQEHSRYYYTANFPAILRTHPLDDDRIAEAENRTARLVLGKFTSSLDYFLFKELIRTAVTEHPQELVVYYAQQCAQQSPGLACQYGQALNLLNNNAFQKAQAVLTALIAQQKDNLYFQIAMGQAELGLGHYAQALARYTELQTNYPDNYAALMAYASGLTAANQAMKASTVLLKGFRQYPRDLPLCRALARAQALSHQKSYAYFTQSQCLLLEGQARASVAQLKVAQKLAVKDAYLSARIAAKMDEIKNNMPSLQTKP